MDLRRKLLALLAADKAGPEYTELEYLESTGTQYIDLGVIPNNTMGVKAKFYVNSASGKNYVLGSRGAGAGRFYLYSTESSPTAVRYGWGPLWATTSVAPVVGTPVEASLNYLNDRKYIYDGTEVNSNLQNDGFSNNTYNLYLFNSNFAGVFYSDAILNGRIYSCQITQDDKVIMDLIPVLDKDFTPCMYDKVTGKYFYNQGDGEFKWKLPNQLEYLGVDGNQWIDTGFAPSSNTRVVGSVLFDKWLGNANYIFGVYGDNANFGFNVGSARGYFNVPWYNNAGLRVSVTPSLNTIFNFDISKDGMITNGNLFTDPLLASTFQAERTMFIGWCNGTTQNKMSGRIYTHKIYENDVLIQYLIPAFDEDLTVCMYDLVSRKYYYNQGSGTFKGYFEDGSQLVSYLSATGTQWIDTGIIPLMGDELELKNVQCKKKSSGMQTVFSAGTGSHQLIILVADGGYSDRASFYKYFASGGAKNINPPNYLNNPTKIKIDSEGNVFYNDAFIIQSPPEKETDSSLRLFYRANNSQPMTGNIGAVNLKRNDEFVINLVPVVKSDGTACMLDLVSKNYFVNQGSGSFNYG